MGPGVGVGGGGGQVCRGPGFEPPPPPPQRGGPRDKSPRRARRGGVSHGILTALSVA